MDKISKMISFRGIVALLLLCSVLLVACESGNATPTSGTSGTTATATTGGAATGGTATTGATTEVATATTGTTGGATETTTGGATGTQTTTGGTTGTPSAGGTTTAGGGGPKLNKDVSGNIEMWHFWSSPVRRNAIRRVIGICEAQLPNIKVNEDPKPFGDIWTANTAAVAAGSGMPDVIVADRPKLPQDAANNIYTDLQPMATRDGITGQEFWPFTWKQTLYKGDTYGLPFETDVRVLFYNKNAFTAAGLDPTKPPKTWDDLMAYADKLDKKNPDGTYARMAFFPLFGNVSAEIWGYADGQQWITPDGKIEINTPQAVDTYKFIKSWIDRYGGWQNVKNFQATFQSPPNDAFMSGKVAMIVDVNGYASQLNFYNPQYTDDKGKKARLDWGVSDMPYKTKQASWSGGFALSIPKGAKNADAAWEFIKCASGPDGATSWSRDTYAMSANVQAAHSPELLGDPAWKFFLNAMNYSTGGNYLEKYPNWDEQLGQREEDVWTGKTTPEQMLQDAQKAVEDQVNKQ